MVYCNLSNLASSLFNCERVRIMYNMYEIIAIHVIVNAVYNGSINSPFVCASYVIVLQLLLLLLHLVYLSLKHNPFLIISLY